MASSSEPPVLGPKEQFFRYFQLEATALQQQMAKLATLPASGGERIDAIDHCLSGVARLQKEVQDASSYIPAYDQKIYSEGVKALHEKLDQTRVSLQPKSKFAFKHSIKKNESAISLSDAAELALEQKSRLMKDPRDLTSSTESSTIGTPGAASPSVEGTVRPAEPHRQGSLGSFLDAAGMKDGPSPGIATKEASIQRMSFASAKAVSINSHNGVHIILPSSAANATSSGSLTNLENCIVDMSTPTTTGKPFATLAIKNVTRSLLICGSVSGAAHVTGVKYSVLVVAARQFRMHDCHNCIVYLHANGQPIIEDCKAVQFAPLSKRFSPTAEDLTSGENQWDQIQDFKWLKAEPSPNWTILAEEKRVSEDQWLKITSPDIALSLEKSLSLAGVEKV